MTELVSSTAGMPVQPLPGAGTCALVLGSGPVGYEVAKQLEADGASVRLISILDWPPYDMPGTVPEVIPAHDLDGLVEAAEGVDTIFLCLNAWYTDWYSMFPEAVTGAIVAAHYSGAALVYWDSVYVYGPSDTPYTEDMPHTSKTRKGRLLGVLSDRVINTHRQGSIRAVIGRSASVYGPGTVNAAHGSTLSSFFYPVVKGEKYGFVGHVDLPHSHIYTRDLARGLIRLSREPYAFGQVWHIPSAPAETHRKYADLMRQITGWHAEFEGSRAAAWVMRLLSLHKRHRREVTELLYTVEKPHVVDHSKFEQAFGLDVTRHGLALVDTLEWFRAHREWEDWGEYWRRVLTDRNLRERNMEW